MTLFSSFWCLIYGLQGSGKTFTMTGTADNPGLTPRAIEEMFRIIHSKKEYCTSRVTTYFVELYNDNLVVRKCSLCSALMRPAGFVLAAG